MLEKVLLDTTLSRQPTDIRMPYLLLSNTLSEISAFEDSSMAIPASPLLKQVLSLRQGREGRRGEEARAGGKINCSQRQ